MKLRLASVNDDFGTAASNVPEVAPHADVIFVQEGKRTPIDPLLDTGWGVHQDISSDALAGSALAWRKSLVIVTAVGTTLGVLPHGAAMLARYIAWARGSFYGRRLWLASCHRPPLRYRRLWPLFDAHLAARVRAARMARRLVVIGMDANERDARRLATLCGLKWVAPEGSIDGFLVSKSLRVSDVRRLPRGTSDHHPVLATVHIPRAKGK